MKKSFKLIFGILITLVLMFTLAFTALAYDSYTCAHDDYYYDDYNGQYYCNDCGEYVNCVHDNYSVQYDSNYNEYFHCYDCGNTFYDGDNGCTHYYTHYDEYFGYTQCTVCGQYIECTHNKVQYNYDDTFICSGCGEVLEMDKTPYIIQTALILIAGILLFPWLLLLYIIIFLILALLLFIFGAIVVLLTPILILVGVPVALFNGLLIIF